MNAQRISDVSRGSCASQRSDDKAKGGNTDSCAQKSARKGPSSRPERWIATFAMAQLTLAPRPRRSPRVMVRGSHGRATVSLVVPPSSVGSTRLRLLRHQADLRFTVNGLPSKQALDDRHDLILERFAAPEVS